MNENVKRLWLKALRSGKYRRTRFRLRTESGYCCLGVLCDLYQQETGLGAWVKSPDGTAYSFNVGNDTGNYYLIPSAVLEWAGMAYKNGEYRHQRNMNLADANDSPKVPDEDTSFNCVIHKIKRHWKVL